MIKFFQSLIKLYKLLLSPLLGTRCRYAPTCSEYAHQALEEHGFIKGSVLAIKRVVRCNPWGGSGFDPVPEKQKTPETE